MIGKLYPEAVKNTESCDMETSPPTNIVTSPAAKPIRAITPQRIIVAPSAKPGKLRAPATLSK